MAYVEEFRNQLQARDYSKVMQLWHEYCQGDIPDGQEIVEILRLIKQSDFAKPFGQYVEAILPITLTVQEEDLKIEALKLIFDLQVTNSQALFLIAQDHLKTRFSQDPTYNEKIRLVGMRNADNFQGALSNFYLLNHIQNGNFVMHTAGWGVGEIVEFSFLREQVSIEFENLNGAKKDISFKNAFKTLVPLAKDHFLARRFADADALEAEARENPVQVIHNLLLNLGPQTASEIKDLFSDAVIPEDDYSKWWQQARVKLKKDDLIESPDNPKMPYTLRKGSASVSDRLSKAFSGKKTFQDILTAAHNLIRDFPETLKDAQSKEQITSKIKSLLEAPKISEDEFLQTLLFLEHSLGYTAHQDTLKAKIADLKDVNSCLKNIEIVALKKRFLMLLQTLRSDWQNIFLDLLFVIDQNSLRDYLLKELDTDSTRDQLKRQLQDLMEHPKKYPEALVWYFQKIIDGEEKHYQDQHGKALAFEAFLILFHSLDQKIEVRDLSKKMYNLLTAQRFEVVRNFLKTTTLQFAQEFLLLTSKCQAFSDHDKKILNSLVAVAHPSLAEAKVAHAHDHEVLWTTQDGYNKVHDRIKQIGTIEMVSNAREVETARGHGDLRENAEYKAACERRSRLQSELKALSDQFRHARIITKDDIVTDVISVGAKVTIEDQKKNSVAYTILGPWDANPDANVLSFQSKLAQAMLGKKTGESFEFKNDNYKVVSIKSFLE
ncbi:MAG: GreA/GreB family elongation factor [Chlamydiales bacterium]|nr:GreA/GreB family elongation factor [Chlamydiales bacterium]